MHLCTYCHRECPTVFWLENHIRNIHNIRNYSYEYNVVRIERVYEAEIIYDVTEYNENKNNSKGSNVKNPIIINID